MRHFPLVTPTHTPLHPSYTLLKSLFQPMLEPLGFLHKRPPFSELIIPKKYLQTLTHTYLTLLLQKKKKNSPVPRDARFFGFNAHQRGMQLLLLHASVCCSWTLHLIMTYQKPKIQNYEWESPESHPAPRLLNHLISISHHKKEHSLTASASSLLVTGALWGGKKVYFSKPSVGESWPEYITDWYVIIKHWPSGSEEEERDGRMGARDGEKLGWWRGNRKRWGSLENYKLVFWYQDPNTDSRVSFECFLYLCQNSTWVVVLIAKWYTFLNSSS